jgi:hypothetical protein
MLTFRIELKKDDVKKEEERMIKERYEDEDEC